MKDSIYVRNELKIGVGEVLHVTLIFITSDLDPLSSGIAIFVAIQDREAPSSLTEGVNSTIDSAVLFSLIQF